MTSGCPPIEQLEELIALDAGDPRRTHLESCPRCRSRMLAFRSFMEMHPVPDGARLEDARKQLSSVLREESARAREGAFAEGRSADARSAETLSADARASDARPADARSADARSADARSADARSADARAGDARPADARSADTRSADTRLARQAPTSTERRPRRGLLDWFAPRQRRLAFGLAALTLAVIVTFQVTGVREDTTPLHMRGAEETEEVTAPPLHSVRPDGALELRWAAVEGAETYRLVFSGSDLREILRVEAGSGTRHVLPAETVAGLGSPGSVVFWRVLALRGGDTIAQSPPATLTLP